MSGGVPRVTMRQALEDENLLGRALAGVSRLMWRALLIAAMGELLTDEERAAFMRATGRQHEPLERIDEFWGIVGRRGGKTSAIAAFVVYLVCLIIYDHVLAAGERGVVLVIAKTMNQAEVVISYVSGILHASPVLSAMIAWENETEIILTNDIRIEAAASSFRDLRSRTCVAIVVDEVAFLHDDSQGSKNPDSEILIAVRPSLLTTKGPFIAIGSAYARRGEMFKAHRRDYGPDGDPLVLIAQGPTIMFNPTVDQATVDRLVARDPVSGRSEYYAEFRSAAGDSYLSYDEVDRVIVAGQQTLPPQPGVSYTAGCDPSGGGGSDSMTLAICHVEGGVKIVDDLLEVVPPFNTDETVRRFAQHLVSYGVSSVTGDAYANEWVIQAFARFGIVYGPPADKKRSASEFYLEARPYFSNAQVALPDNERLRTQLTGLTRRAGSGGRDSVDHPQGAHDDLTNAVAIAIVMASIADDPAAIWSQLASAAAYQIGAGPRPAHWGPPGLVPDGVGRTAAPPMSGRGFWSPQP